MTYDDLKEQRKKEKMEKKAKKSRRTETDNLIAAVTDVAEGARREKRCVKMQACCGAFYFHPEA